MPAQEALHRLIQREERVQRARPRQHHHETGEPPLPPRPERAPIDLCLFAGQGAQPQKRFAERSWPQRTHQPAQLHHRAAIAARAQHLVEPRGPQLGVLLQRLAHERQIGIELRGPRLCAPHRVKAFGLDGVQHGVAMHAERGGDGTDLPVLGVEQPADLRAVRRRNHCGLCCDGSRPAMPGRTPAPRQPARLRGRMPAEITAVPATAHTPHGFLGSLVRIVYLLRRLGGCRARDHAFDRAGGGTFLRHAGPLTRPVGALPIAVIQAPFFALVSVRSTAWPVWNGTCGRDGWRYAATWC